MRNARTITVGLALVALGLAGCTGKTIAGLQPADCAAGKISLVLSGAKITPKPGSQSMESVTVTATCTDPAGPLKNVDLQVAWPSGKITKGKTDANGVTTVSENFPTDSSPGQLLVSMNGSDDKSQNEKGDIK